MVTTSRQTTAGLLEALTLDIKDGAREVKYQFDISERKSPDFLVKRELRPERWALGSLTITQLGENILELKQSILATKLFGDAKDRFAKVEDKAYEAGTTFI